MLAHNMSDTLGGMTTESRKRGPQTGYVRMTFDMKAEDRARLKVCAALASQAEGKPITMGNLLERWARAGMGVLEKEIAKKRK